MGKMKMIIIGITIIATMGIFTIGKTEFGLFMKNKYQKQLMDADRKAFEGSKSYVKGAAMDLADYKYQYNGTKDKASKEAIRQLVRDRFADLNAKDLNNVNLQNFLVEMRGY